MIDLHARVAVLEDQNETCSEERKALDKRLGEHRDILNQVRGGVRILIALFVVLTTLLGLREVEARVSGAAAATAPR